MKKLTNIALFLAAFASLEASAHEGHAHKVLGTVVSMSPDQIEVSGPEGKKEAWALTRETVFKKDKTVAAAKDVTVGTRVVLSVVEKDGKKTVKEVLIGVVTPTATPHKH